MTVVPLSLGAEPASLAGSRAAAGQLGRRIGRPLMSGVTSLVAVVLLWEIFLKAFHLNPLVAKSPLDVWHYLATGSGAGAHRQVVGSALLRTLGDAGLGFVVGLLTAAALALVFVMLGSVEAAFLPLAVLIRSVPLVAMTPVLTLIFGRGLLGVTVISGIVVFFPALVTMTFGLRSTSRQASELCRAYGADGWVVARKVMLPSALPAFFASARVAVPGALIGALLAEWLATGQGLGYGMLLDSQTFEYTQLWASVAVLTVVSVLVYYLVAALEGLVLARFGATGS